MAFISNNSLYFHAFGGVLLTKVIYTALECLNVDRWHYEGELTQASGQTQT